MPDVSEYYKGLKEWSARKHNLLNKYLISFVRILGGSWGQAYYVDGFAGPGLYDDGAKGSPLLAAEYAYELTDKLYTLHCINIEPNEELFANLERNTRPYARKVTNLPGTFSENVDHVLTEIGDLPTLFFLDPFGIRGVEWDVLAKVLQRPYITELLLRVDPVTIQRLAGSHRSVGKGSVAKVRSLNEFYGFSSARQWHQVWKTERIDGMLNLYLRRLAKGIDIGHGGNAWAYDIKEIGGDLKYYLAFATRHPKGATLMNDIIYNAEETYQREVEEFRGSRVRQLSLFDPEPTAQDIFADKVQRVKEVIWRKFQGERPSLLDIRAAMLIDPWFGKIKKTHITQAVKELEENGRITDRTGPRSDDYTNFTFRGSSA